MKSSFSILTGLAVFITLVLGVVAMEDSPPVAPPPRPHKVTTVVSQPVAGLYEIEGTICIGETVIPYATAWISGELRRAVHADANGHFKTKLPPGSYSALVKGTLAGQWFANQRSFRVPVDRLVLDLN